MADAPTGSFCWVELATTNLASSKAFYGSLFDWAITDTLIDGVPYAVAAGARGEVAGMSVLSREAKKSGTSSYWFSYIAVDDPPAVAVKAALLGGKIVVGPLEMGPASVAVVRDPTGAVFGLWHWARAREDAHRGYAAAVALNELSTPDINRAGSFYAGLFGWQDLASARAAVPYKTFKLGERIVAGMMQAQPAPRAAAEWTVYFSVTDAAATVARAESLGAGAVIPLHDVAGAGRLAVLTDPEGAVFAVIEPGGGVS
jgi:predicted enzyme related to lactoylglutathione lyase